MKARNFRKIDGMAYTRKGYIGGGIPQPRITKFTMGDPSGDFESKVELLSMERAHISHNALEAARIAANRVLESSFSREGFYLKVVQYPHDIIRHHKRVSVAQADRYQEGMKRCYGKPFGTAARIEPGELLITIGVNKSGVDTAKEALKRASAKFPITTKIIAH